MPLNRDETSSCRKTQVRVQNFALVRKGHDWISQYSLHLYGVAHILHTAAPPVQMPVYNIRTLTEYESLTLVS